jgi:hypothetical protein
MILFAFIGLLLGCVALFESTVQKFRGFQTPEFLKRGMITKGNKMLYRLIDI